MKLARLVSIIMLLLQHKKITASRLAEMFEVSTRTIYRDIEAIGQAGHSGSYPLVRPAAFAIAP